MGTPSFSAIHCATSLLPTAVGPTRTKALRGDHVEADADADAAVRDVEGGEVALADEEVEEVDDVAEDGAVDEVADDAAREQDEGDAPEEAVAEDLRAVAREDDEHHDGQRHQQEAPAAQDAPGGAAVLHVGEAEEARNDRTGLVEGERGSDNVLGGLVEGDEEEDEQSRHH